MSLLNDSKNTFLKTVKLDEKGLNFSKFPFDIPAFSKGINLSFKSPLTLFVGENGSGKSTLLEAIAKECGFSLAGGGLQHSYGESTPQTESILARFLRLSWAPKVRAGFFMRTESFFSFASYIDEISKDFPSVLQNYGGASLHQQSHGESFLSLFQTFKKGIFLLDEPEAALSPKRQLSFLSLVHDLEQQRRAQFIIATHSPILLAYPGATVYQFDDSGIIEVDYRDTEHFTLTKSFLDDPSRYFHYLWGEQDQ